jgi:hypothetical protein
VCRVDNTPGGSKNALSSMSYDNGNRRRMTNSLLGGSIHRTTWRRGRSGEFGQIVARLRTGAIPGTPDV